MSAGKVVGQVAAAVVAVYVIVILAVVAVFMVNFLTHPKPVTDVQLPTLSVTP